MSEHFIFVAYSYNFCRILIHFCDRAVHIVYINIVIMHKITLTLFTCIYFWLMRSLQYFFRFASILIKLHYMYIAHSHASIMGRGREKKHCARCKHGGDTFRFGFEWKSASVRDANHFTGKWILNERCFWCRRVRFVVPSRIIIYMCVYVHLCVLPILLMIVMMMMVEYKLASARPSFE